MKKDFNLSERIYKFDINPLKTKEDLLLTKDVKEFIKRLKEEIDANWQYHNQYGDCVGKGCASCSNINWIRNKIDKLAGDDLK